MLIVLIVFLSLIVSAARLPEDGRFHRDYLSRENTVPIEGIFVLFVFFRHFGQHVLLKAAVDTPLKSVDSYMGQLIVVPFLFYTGYGTMLSLAEKGRAYFWKLPVKFLKLLLRFDLCVLLYWVYAYLTGTKYSLSRLLQSMIAWRAVGNSNWYVFCLFAFYFIIFVSFLFDKKQSWLGAAFSTVLTVLYILVLKKVGKADYWYNTAVALPMGMWFYYIKKPLERLIDKYKGLYMLLLLTGTVGFVFFQQYRGKRLLYYLILSCIFAGLILLASMKIKLQNGFLNYIGKHVFSIYILQRIPMMLFVSLGISKPFSLFLVSFVSTLFMAALFDHFIKWLETRWPFSGFAV